MTSLRSPVLPTPPAGGTLPQQARRLGWRLATGLVAATCIHAAANAAATAPAAPDVHVHPWVVPPVNLQPSAWFTTARDQPVRREDVQGRPRVEILSPADGAALQNAFRVVFHASGLNVAHADARASGTGHFRLTLERKGARTEVLSFRDGQTETWLEPPAGDYRMKLELVNNTNGQVMAASPAVRVRSDVLRDTSERAQPAVRVAQQ
jgi:hypothetical protein